jgi:hypothetical protein
MEHLVRVELYINAKFIACFGIILNEHQIVIKTAPIGKWMLGKKFSEIKEYYSKTRFNGTQLKIYENPLSI